MNKQYHSHGKFLLTGEYLVLKGALALALPLKLGQSFEVERLETVTLNRENLVNFSTDDPDKAMRLCQILQAVKQLNPKAFEGNDIKFTTRLDFDPNWGLGSSSTLIANLARWAKVNPYELLKLTFGGSGYDIACATADGPIYYQLVNLESALRQAQEPQQVKVVEPVETPTPMVKSVAFQPSFSEHLFFVYQGQKQSSSKEIKAFLEKANPIDIQNDIESVSEISRAVPKCESLDEFALLMQCHERIIARCIGQEPVQKRFPDFEGVLKSLGAWGGDFILAATGWDETQVKEYFKRKGLEVVFGYKEIVLNE